MHQAFRMCADSDACHKELGHNRDTKMCPEMRMNQPLTEALFMAGNRPA